MTLALLALLGGALAQDTNLEQPAPINAQLFRPSVDARYTLWTDDTGDPAASLGSGRLVMGYALNSLVFTREDERVVHLRHLANLDLLGSIRAGPVRFGLHVPVYVTQGDLTGTEGGIGDLAVDVRATVLRPTNAPIGLAISGRLHAPTTTVDAPVGDGNWAGEGQIIIDRPIGPVFLAANVGYRAIPRVDLNNVIWDDQIFFRVGGAISVTPSFGILAESVAHFAYNEFGSWNGTPAELLVGGWHRMNNGLVIRGAAGTALSGGVGAPNLRILMSLAYEPQKDLTGGGNRVLLTLVTEDGDPIGGGWVDVSIDEGSRGGNSGDTWFLEEGAYEYRASAGGYQPHRGVLEIPEGHSEHEITLKRTVGLGSLQVTVVDEDFKALDAQWSIEGSAGPRIRGGYVEMELPPGVYPIVVTADGFNPVAQTLEVFSREKTKSRIVMPKKRVKVTRQRIAILDRVHFEYDSATIKKRSYNLLEEVANTLRAFPEIKRVRVEGHTDARGTETYNQDLSDMRVQAVVDFLIDYGVDPSRLTLIGFGESNPVRNAETESAWAENRRVEFHIVEWEDMPADIEDR